jgi:peptide chain release factor 1
MTVYALDDFMNGDINEMVEALQFAENSEKMKAGESV